MLSRPLALDRVATGAALKDALGSLLGQLEASEGDRKRQRRGAERERLASSLEAIVCELYAASRANISLHLAYSRDTSYYTRKSRYGHPTASVTAVTAVADFSSYPLALRTA